MKLLTKTPIKTNIYLHDSYFSNYKNRTPYIGSKLSYEKYEINNRSCNCSCHKHNRNNQKFHRDLSYNNLSSNKLRNAELNSKVSNNSTHKNQNMEKNKTEYNLIINPTPNQNYYLFRELKKNYVPRYNYSVEKTYDNRNNINKNININNHNHKNVVSANKNNSYNNHSFIDIKDTSKTDENKEKLYRVKLQRKQLAKFYHYMGLKKYPYGKGKIETTNNTANHKYVEIFDNSKENKNNNTNIVNTNKKYNNHRYSFSQYLSRNKNEKTELEEKKDSEAQSKIIKETSNTRLLEVKSPSKENRYIYNRNPYFSDNRKNLLNNYSYDIRNDYNNIDNLNKNNNNYKYEVIRNVSNTPNNKNTYNNRPELNLNNKYDSYITPNYNQIQNKHNIKYNHIPYSLLSRNQNLEQCHQYHLEHLDMKNDNTINKKLCMLRNNQINNLNYNILKQKVRLSLLKKQIYEQKRNMILNNNRINNIHKYNCDNGLYDKTRKLMNNNNYLGLDNNINNIDYKEKQRINMNIDSNLEEK